MTRIHTFITIISISLISCMTTLAPMGPSAEEMPQADRIILKTDRTEYKEVAQYLSEKGYAIIESNADIGVVQTDFKGYDANGTRKIKVSVLVKTDEIHFYGIHLSELGESEIENIGQKGSISKKSWEALKSLATDYPHTSILFKRS
jgi:hypothetical protein